MKPIHDRIVVERERVQEKTKGGLYIPDAAKDKPQRGTVIAVGQGYLHENGSLRPLVVKPGDTILFGKYAGTEIELDDKPYLMMREDDVLMIID